MTIWLCRLVLFGTSLFSECYYSQGYQTGVEEGTGSRSSWTVVATDLSCLHVMMMRNWP